MKRFFATTLIFLWAFAVIGLAPCLAQNQNLGPQDKEIQDMGRSFGMDPALCEGLQNQIDKVVNIAHSAASEDEKVSQLTEALAESLKNMRESGTKDPEVDRIVKQYLTIIEGLLATARDSWRAGDKQIPADAKNEMEKLKIMTGTYLSMMRIMCPKLKLPDVMTNK
ncbi:MAG: hypothetical protein HY913_18845 [Desulfomonile tiedjei]|nr:hypothetical protein [Desulfomonile tiedjei]